MYEKPRRRSRDIGAGAQGNSEDSLGISWGASYDLGVTKPMILVQYGKNENTLGGFNFADFDGNKDADGNVGLNEGLKGFAVSLGAVTPLAGGNLYTAVNYTDGEVEGDGVDLLGSDSQGITGDIQRWGVAVGYDYPLSKRTKVYGFAAYNEGEWKQNWADVANFKYEEKDIEAGVGLIHYF